MNNLRHLIRFLIHEQWSQHLDQFMFKSDPLPFNNDEEEDISDNPLNPYDSANDSLRKVKANSHTNTQKAGVKRGSGLSYGNSTRYPGGSKQGISPGK